MFLDQTLLARFRQEELDEIDKIVEKDKEKYNNRSSFFRVAVIKLIREEKEKEKEKNK